MIVKGIAYIKFVYVILLADCVLIGSFVGPNGDIENDQFLGFLFG